MENKYALLATYTYPHEAVFIQSALVAGDVPFIIQHHKALIHNSFYANPEMVKHIFVEKCHLQKALQIIQSIKSDLHIQNRCNLIHSSETASSIPSTKAEKGFCFTCYALMLSSLGAVIWAILDSLQCFY